MYRLLIADDDVTMLNTLTNILLDEGYDVTAVTSSRQAMDKINQDDFDLFLLNFDLGDDKKAGVKICRYIRNTPTEQEKPIIFLTSRSNTLSAVETLEIGGDDYVRKPFAVRELTARIRAHLRRANLLNRNNKQLRLNPDTFKVYVDDREISLTRIEFDLLYFMIHAPQRWFSTRALLMGVWNYPDNAGDAALVRNHIRNLRRKLEADPDRPAIIQSRHGRGYSISANVQLEYAV
jgi:DNA-binding response OmpR family regulator